jgi:hypothetical protein
MKKPQGMDMVIASLRSIRGLFHDREEFTADVTRFCNDLREIWFLKQATRHRAI